MGNYAGRPRGVPEYFPAPRFPDLSRRPAPPGKRGAEHDTRNRYPLFDEETWFNRFRVGIWPDYFEGVQFSRDKEALNQYFRQMTPTLGPPDLDVYAKAYAALFDRIVRLSSSPFAGRRCRMAYTAADKEHPCHRAYEPGTNVPFPEADAGGRESTNPVEEDRGVEVPMEEFLQFTKIPIIIYYGDNLPKPTNGRNCTNGHDACI